MNHDNHDPTPLSNRAGSLSLEQRLDNIEATLKAIQDAINQLIALVLKGHTP